MARRKRKQNKRRNHHNSKNKQRKGKANKQSKNKQHKSKNRRLTSIAKMIPSVKDIFDVQQTEDDLTHVAKLREDLYTDFGVNSDLKDLQKYTEFDLLYFEQLKHFYRKNSALRKEINDKIPALHNKYGRGAFVSSFARACHAKQMKFDTFIRKEYSYFIESKSQILANGTLIWLPLDTLNMIFPPVHAENATKRNNYAMDKFYYNVTLFYVDCPHNLNYIVQESLNSNDELHREYYQKIQRYISDNDNASGYSVKKFSRKFPELASFLTPVSDDKYVQQAQQDSFLQYLNENRFKTLLDAAKPVSTKEFVQKILDETLPKSALIAFLNNSDDIDDSSKSEITRSLKCIYGEEMENVLVEKCTLILQLRQQMKEANKCSFLYESELEDQLCCVRTIQTEIFSKIRSIDQDVITRFLCVYFKAQIQAHPQKNRIVNSLFNWDDFSKKLVGRKCANCGRQENLFDDNYKIERFSKCSSCQSVFYCNSKCQKIDWNKQHHKECKYMTNRKQFIESVNVLN